MSPNILFWLAFFRIFSSTVRSLISLYKNIRSLNVVVLLKPVLTNQNQHTIQIYYNDPGQACYL